MFAVGFSFGKLGTDKRDNGRKRIGKIIDSTQDNSDRIGKQTSEHLEDNEKDVCCNVDKRYLTNGAIACLQADLYFQFSAYFAFLSFLYAYRTFV